jgi:hypothetical protein
VLKQAGKMLKGKWKEDMERNPQISIRFSPDPSPEGLRVLPELDELHGDDLLQTVPRVRIIAEG